MPVSGALSGSGCEGCNHPKSSGIESNRPGEPADCQVPRTLPHWFQSLGAGRFNLRRTFSSAHVRGFKAIVPWTPKALGHSSTRSGLYRAEPTCGSSQGRQRGDRQRRQLHLLGLAARLVAFGLRSCGCGALRCAFSAAWRRGLLLLPGPLARLAGASSDGGLLHVPDGPESNGLLVAFSDRDVGGSPREMVDGWA